MAEIWFRTQDPLGVIYRERPRLRTIFALAHGVDEDRETPLKMLPTYETVRLFFPWAVIWIWYHPPEYDTMRTRILEAGVYKVLAKFSREKPENLCQDTFFNLPIGNYRRDSTVCMGTTIYGVDNPDEILSIFWRSYFTIERRFLGPWLQNPEKRNRMEDVFGDIGSFWRPLYRDPIPRPIFLAP